MACSSSSAVVAAVKLFSDQEWQQHKSSAVRSSTSSQWGQTPSETALRGLLQETIIGNNLGTAIHKGTAYHQHQNEGAIT